MIGMSCTSVLVPHVVQDSTGIIKYIALHPVDQGALCGVRPPAEYKLEYPPTLYVKVDGVDHEFLPPIPCTEHADLSYIDREHRLSVVAACPACQTFAGLIQIRPQKALSWHTMGAYSIASRIPPGRVRGAIFRLMGPSWDILAPSWANLGPSWGQLGPSWG